MNGFRDEGANINTTVKFGIPISDVLYANFRKELVVSANLLKSDPNANIKSSGTLILSHKVDELDYNIRSTSFGKLEDIIDTLTYTLIDMLKKIFPPYKDIKKKLLNGFISYYMNLAINIFYNDNDCEDLDSPEPDNLFCLYRNELIANCKHPSVHTHQSGIILLSERIGDRIYQMNNVVFGKDENIIKTLAITIIKELKQNTVQDNEAIEKMIATYMCFFKEEVNTELFDKGSW